MYRTGSGLSSLDGIFCRLSLQGITGVQTLPEETSKMEMPGSPELTLFLSSHCMWAISREESDIFHFNVKNRSMSN